MGIQGLAKVIADMAPNAMKENEIKNFFGRKVAIDASMSIYQFLIAVRSEGNVLTNEMGETTSHLMGIFYRTIRLLDNGIKPFYVFDGKPPTMKSGELAKRGERRAEAQLSLKEAEEAGNQENIEKYSRRLVKVTPQHNEECQKLLKLMGIPFMIAPCEAEAQCAHLVKSGKVFATCTEDMDALSFGSNILLRHMTFSEARKMPIKEYHLERILEGFEMNMNEFIDLCILLGCDYCETIKGIGPKNAMSLMKKHKSIESILENIDLNRYPIPDDWKFKEARQLFLDPEILDAKNIQIQWSPPDSAGLIEYMVKEKGFSEERILSGIKRIEKSRNTSTQGRLDSFFKPLPNSAPLQSLKRKNSAQSDKKASLSIGKKSKKPK
eukprot:Sdes_comp19793_c0_seq1m11884